MPEFILGARGHDFGRHDPETLFSSIGQAGFACTQLAFTKAVEGVKSYADVTPALVERARAAAAASGVGIAVDGTYVELSYADEDKRRAEVAKVLSQIPVAKALGAGCMGSETTNMAKQPGVTRKEAQEALLRSLGEILPACEEQGVLFAVECVYYHAMNTPEAVRMVLDTMASPNLRVICDFANYVGPEASSVDAQRRIWDKVGSWYGDKITAVHFKGQNFQPDGTLYSTSLEDSCVDYAGGFEMLIPQFRNELAQLLNSDAPIIGVIKGAENAEELRASFGLGEKFTMLTDNLRAVLANDEDTVVIEVKQRGDETAKRIVEAWVKEYAGIK